MRTRYVIRYALIVFLFSSVDLAYEWYAPLVGSEGPFDWYSEIGVRNGVLLLGNHPPPGGGVVAGIHPPRFFPLPAGAIGGPEGGAIFVTTWFVGGIALIGHLVLLSKRQRLHLRTHGTGNNRG